VAIQRLEDYLQSFFSKEKISLLSNYPGLTLHRLRRDIKLYALLKGIDSEELFETAYLPSRNNPMAIFFDKLKTGVPLEYIAGQAYFYRSSFKVTPDVLIPRSETEILVELAAQEIPKNYRNKTCRVVDVGTGSGAIALSLMMEDNVVLDIVASDISDEALRVAHRNYFNLKFEIPSTHNIQFVKSDRLQSVAGQFDIILSNPPYIKSLSDRDTVHQQVHNFEPALALYLEDNVYDQWFSDFLKSIYQKLNSGGMSLIEGHELHLEGLKELAQKIGFAKAEIIKDYTGRNRFIRLIRD